MVIDPAREPRGAVGSWGGQRSDRGDGGYESVVLQRADQVIDRMTAIMLARLRGSGGELTTLNRARAHSKLERPFAVRHRVLDHLGTPTTYYERSLMTGLGDTPMSVAY